jgi:uncharacterized protein (TIGR02466 family)
MEIINRELITLYPTCIFAGRVSDITLCDRLEASCRAMYAAKDGKIDHSNFMSQDNIHTRAEMKELVDLVMKEANEILNFLRVKRDSHYITNMWANITNPNHRHALHIHPNCLLSGIIYVRAPKDCGHTVFDDPRPGARILVPSYSEMTPVNMGLYRVVPEKGLMLIWPSYLPHAVERGDAVPTEERIVIAFNVMIRGTIALPTAYLELK